MSQARVFQTYFIDLQRLFIKWASILRVKSIQINIWIQGFHQNTGNLALLPGNNGIDLQGAWYPLDRLIFFTLSEFPLQIFVFSMIPLAQKHILYKHLHLYLFTRTLKLILCNKQSWCNPTYTSQLLPLEGKPAFLTCLGQGLSTGFLWKRLKAK